LNNFVAERLLRCEERKVSFRDPLTKNEALTFSSLFEVGHTQSALGKQTSKLTEKFFRHSSVPMRQAEM